MSPASAQPRLEAFAEACRAAGFDLSATFDTAWFNDTAGTDEPLPDFGRRGALAIVVGNSRALWPVFVEYLRHHPQAVDATDPIDEYSEAAITQAAALTLGRHTILWSHRLQPRALPIQRLAEIAGLAHLSPAKLCIHPIFGPWIGLRAVIVLDSDGPGGSPTTLPDPCGACSSACMPAYRAVAARPLDEQSWHDWLAVRQACPLGAEWRYDASQTRYHYTKDRSLLQMLIAAPSAG